MRVTYAGGFATIVHTERQHNVCLIEYVGYFLSTPAEAYYKSMKYFITVTILIEIIAHSRHRQELIQRIRLHVDINIHSMAVGRDSLNTTTLAEFCWPFRSTNERAPKIRHPLPMKRRQWINDYIAIANFPVCRKARFRASIHRDATYGYLTRSVLRTTGISRIRRNWAKQESDHQDSRSRRVPCSAPHFLPTPSVPGIGISSTARSDCATVRNPVKVISRSTPGPDGPNVHIWTS